MCLLKIFKFFFMIIKLFGENRLVKSTKLLLFKTNSINPHIIESYACILMNLLISLWNMLYTKTIKICYFVVFLKK